MTHAKITEKLGGRRPGRVVSPGALMLGVKNVLATLATVLIAHHALIADEELMMIDTKPFH